MQRGETFKSSLTSSRAACCLRLLLRSHQAGGGPGPAILAGRSVFIGHLTRDKSAELLRRLPPDSVSDSICRPICRSCPVVQSSQARIVWSVRLESLREWVAGKIGRQD